MTNKVLLPPIKPCTSQRIYWRSLVPMHATRRYFAYIYNDHYVDVPELKVCWQLLAAWMAYEPSQEHFQRLVQIYNAIRDQPPEHVRDILDVYHRFYQQRQPYETACRRKRWSEALLHIRNLVNQWENYYQNLDVDSKIQSS